MHHANTVSTGLDTLIDGQPGLVRHRRIGVLCHAASVDRHLIHAVDRLRGAGAEVLALFGPEHGLQASAQDMVEVDSATLGSAKLPVHSLYGDSLDSLTPKQQWLAGLDALVVDLQDVGSRYYTYVWSMALCLGACAQARVQVVVLDRPNPLGGERIEGPSIEPGFESFVGLHPVPVRHGLTIGEMAGLLRAELRLDLELTVVPLRGWRRAMLFDQTGLPWVAPSPNMPTQDTALVYPGGCLLEGTNLSEGRGTTKPFEQLGAPWVDGARLAASLEDLGLPGVSFRPLGFVPAFQKHRDRRCGGVQIHPTNRHRFRPFLTGAYVVAQTRILWPEHFAWREEPYEFVADRPAIDLLAGGGWLREQVDVDGLPAPSQLAARWEPAEARFMDRRAPYLIYD